MAKFEKGHDEKEKRCLFSLLYAFFFFWGIVELENF